MSQQLKKIRKRKRRTAYLDRVRARHRAARVKSASATRK